MDAQEKMAIALENDQTDRYRKSTDKVNFWRPEEIEIYEMIKTFRSQSKTYHPDNQR